MKSLPSLLCGPLLMLYASHGLSQAVDPEPFGGKADMEAFIDEELVYPSADLANGVSGRTEVLFTVNANGSVSAMRVWRSLSPACDAEALRIARLIRWHPATFDGEARATEQTLRIDFDPKRYARLEKKRTTTRPADEVLNSSSDLFATSDLDSLPQPMILGGLRGMPDYLAQRMKYPQDAFARSLEGTVRLEFTVEASGNLANIRALQTVGGGCTDEARRLLRTMRWMPGMKDGRRVRSVQEVSIQFKLGTTQR